MSVPEGFTLRKYCKHLVEGQKDEKEAPDFYRDLADLAEDLGFEADKREYGEIGKDERGHHAKLKRIYEKRCRR